MKKLSGVILYVLLIASTFGQNPTIDSLKSLLPGATDEEKIAIYNELGLNYRGISYPFGQGVQFRVLSALQKTWPPAQDDKRLIKYGYCLRVYRKAGYSRNHVQ